MSQSQFSAEIPGQFLVEINIFGQPSRRNGGVSRNHRYEKIVAHELIFYIL
jgi:hypothetical protein